MKPVITSDVVVCGGGTAGLAAALAAARQGSRVCVVEEDAAIGGAPTDMYIQLFCGKPFQGILWELKEKMKEYGVYYQESSFRHSAYLLAYQEFFRGLPVEFYTRQRIRSVRTEDGRITAVETADFRYEGKLFLDCTGDGDVAALAGCPFRYGREAASEFGEEFAPDRPDRAVQRCTLMYTVKWDPSVPHQGPPHPLSPFDGEESLIWGPTVVCEDTTSETALARAHAEALAMLPQHVQKWKERGCYITSVAPKLGVRESRRIEGLHILSFRDIKDRHTFPDSICVVNYNIDPWDPSGNPQGTPEGKKRTFMPDYEIPYRCLVNRRIDNLIVAGRCISATHVANSSLRVMGIAIPLGQAAGNAAHLAATAGCAAREVDTGALRELQRRGGIRVSLDERV